MNTKDWKALKSELEARGYIVSVKGRNKKEYISEKDDHIVDIYRGGVTGTGPKLKVFIYNVDTYKIDFEFSTLSYKQVLEYVDKYDGTAR